MSGFEILGAVATAIDLLQKFADYCEAVAHAEAERMILIRQCQVTAIWLEDMKRNAETESPTDPGFPLLRTLREDGVGLVKRTTSALLELADMLHFEDGFNKISTLDKLTWRFKRSDLKKLSDTLDKLMTEYSLDLNMAGFAGIKKLLSEIKGYKEELAQIQITLRTTERKWIADWIMADHKFSFYANMHERLIDSWCEPTDLWFLETDKFKAWTTRPGTLMLCEGLIGVGKSVLTSLVIDHLRREYGYSDVGIAFLYCTVSNRPDQSAPQMASALLRELVYHAPTLPPAISKTFRQQATFSLRGIRGDNKDELLLSVTTVYRDLYIVVDGLDECVGEARGRLLSVLKKQVAGAQAKLPLPRIHIFIAGSNLGQMRIDERLGVQAEDLMFVEFRALDTDLECWLRRRMEYDDIGTCIGPELENRLTRTVVKLARGRFLAAQYLYDLLLPSAKIDRGDLERNLGNISGSVPHFRRQRPACMRFGDLEAVETLRGHDDIYSNQMEMMLARCPSQDCVVAALRILSVLIYTHERFTVDTLWEALELTESSPFMDEAMHALRGFISVQTRPYPIVDIAGSGFRTWIKDHLPGYHPEAADTMAEICLAALQRYSDGRFSVPLKKLKEMGWGTAGDPQPPISFPQYVLQYWTDHVNGSGEDKHTKAILDLVREPRMTGVLSQELSSRPHQPPLLGRFCTYLGTGTSMHVLAGLNLCSSLLEVLRGSGHDDFVAQLNALDMSSNNTPLLWAAQLGAHEAVALLVADQRTAVHLANCKGRTVLHYAAEHGWTDIITMIFERDPRTDVNRRDIHRVTPLYLAVIEGNKEAVESLLRHGATINVSCVGDPWNQVEIPILVAAAINGGVEVINLLLSDDHTQVDIRGPNGMTPLAFASQAGNTSMVAALIEKGQANVNATSDTGRTSLSYASESGVDSLVRYLLSRPEIGPDRPDEHQRTSLSYAAEHGFVRIMDMLLQNEKVLGNHYDSLSSHLEKASTEGKTALVRNTAHAWM